MTTNNNKKITTREMVITAMFIALTLAATMFINIKLPIPGNGGLIHLGNIPMFVAAFLFGKRTGALAGGIGMGLFDVFSGWTMWAPFTLIIVGAMGFASGAIAEKSKNKLIGFTFAVILACMIKIVGYYFAEVILYHNMIVPLGSIPGNIVQVLVAGVVAVPLSARLYNTSLVKKGGLNHV